MPKYARGISYIFRFLILFYNTYARATELFLTINYLYSINVLKLPR